MNIQQAKQLLADSELITSAENIQKTLIKMAEQINLEFENKYPLVLTVMGGALIYSGHLLPKITTVLDHDYLHVSRYGDETSGGKLIWIATPRFSLLGRDILVLDDILDEGVTLTNIKKHLLENGAKSCKIAVLCEKEINQQKNIKADFVGFRLPNRFVFGFGMDIKGIWRNLPAIYALKK